MRYRLEAIPAYLSYGLFRLLPVGCASALGGCLARAVGRLAKVSRIADRNLQQAMPELDAPARKRVIAGVWDNMGRVAAELPHVAHLSPERITVEGIGTLQSLAASGQPVIFVSAHIGNWEILARVAASHGLPFVRVYRAANNPYVERLIQSSRAAIPGGCLPKGSNGARGILKALKQRQNVGFLVDQRLSDGEMVPFFGQPAQTATAPVDLAIRFGCPVVPAHCVRVGGAHFRVTVHPPLSPTAETRMETLHTLNRMLENWIRATPGQWLWLHRRWHGKG